MLRSGGSACASHKVPTAMYHVYFFYQVTLISDFCIDSAVKWFNLIFVCSTMWNKKMLTDVINCQYRFNKIIIFGDWVQDKYRSIVNWYPVYIYIMFTCNCVCVYMHVYVYNWYPVYITLHATVCVCTCMCMYITGTQYISLYMQLCLCVCVHACVCIYIYIIYIYICMYVCIHVCMCNFDWCIHLHNLKKRTISAKHKFLFMCQLW